MKRARHYIVSSIRAARLPARRATDDHTMYQYTDFDRQFVHAARRAVPRPARAQPGRRAGRRRLPPAAAAERLVHPAPCADAAHRRALRRAAARAAAPAGAAIGRAKLDRGYAATSRRARTASSTGSRCAKPADAMDLLAEVDMHGIQTCGNCIRNITSDALRRHRRPTRSSTRGPYCEILRQWSTLHPEFAFLPRKFKIAVTGAARRPRRDRLARHRPAAAEERRRRGRLQGAGRRRHGPHAGHRHAWSREFLPWHQILVYIEAIVRVYNRYGRRDNTYKARIKILVKAEGQKFFDAVERRVRKILARDVGGTRTSSRRPSSTASPRASRCPQGVAADRRAATAPRRRRARAPTGAGSSATCTRTSSPATAPSRCRSSAPASRPATSPPSRWRPPPTWPTAISWASCASRTTRTWCCRGCARADLRALWHAARDAGFATPNIGLLTDMIACPGGDFCALANARSIPIAAAITERFDDLDELLRHRRHRPAHQRLHQLLRPPPQRPHRHPRRRQGRQRVVPGHRSAAPTARRSAAPRARQGDRPVVRGRRGARRDRGA